MAISFACDQCRKQFSVDGSLAGKRVKCKGCGATLTVPGAAPPPNARRPAAVEVDDPYGLSEGASSADDGTEASEALLPRGRGGRRPVAGQQQSAGIPAWVWFISGGVGLLFVVLIVAVMLSRPKGPQAAADAPAAPGSTTDEAEGSATPTASAPVSVPLPPPSPADLARFKRDDTATAGSGVVWRIKPDPSPEPVEFPPLEKLSITVPKAFAGNRVIYPTTPSPFVMLGGNDADDQFREVWDLRTAKSVGRLSGKIEAAKPMALSPDGAYFVVHTNPVPRTTDVWSIAEAKRIARIEDGKDIPDVIDFAGPGRIVIGTTYAKTLQVWDFLGGKPLAKVETPLAFDADSIALSPGRRYMALILAFRDKLQVYDLTTGRLVGETMIEKNDSATYDCEGLAFSPDGTAIAGLFTAGGSSTHLLCWDATTGKLVSDFASPGTNPYGKSYAYEGQPVQWLPDQSGWLIQDQTFVERQSGQVVWSIAFPPIKYKVHGPRKVLDLGRIIVKAEMGDREAIQLVSLPQDKIKTAMALAKGGKNAVDAILPAIKTADLSGAKKVAPTPGPIDWKTVPAPTLPPALKASAGKAIPVKAQAGDILSVIVSSPDAAQALVVSSPGGRLSGVKGKQAQDPRQVGRIDLAGGRSLDSFEIPSVSTPIAFSPGATHFLLAHAAGLDRLDLHAAAGGKHLAGWRPYDQESGDDRNVAWADFLDAQRVLTVNQAGTLILWSVPDCKAVYVAAQALQGVPLLNPNRKSLAVLRGGALRLLDPATGTPQGDTPSSGHQGATGLNAAGFSPDGQELAAVLDGTIVRWDLKTGQSVGEIPSPLPKPGSLQYGDARHVLLDGKVLFGLESKRPVWYYSGGAHALGGNGAVHCYVASEQIIGPVTLRTIDVPDKKAARAEAARADPKTTALLREGSKVGIQIVGEPARDAETFRRDLIGGLTAQLQQVGVEAADGQPVKLVVKFNVKDTGRNIEFRRMSGNGQTDKRMIQARQLDWELSVTDDKASPVSIARGSVAFTNPGFLENVPNTENDWEGYLRARQYSWGATAVLQHGVPYYAARRPDGGVFLPGRTFLGHPSF